MSTTSDTPSKPVRLREILGLSCALLTPFNKDGAIDWQRFGAHARDLLGSGAKAVTAFGTTGEGVSLSRVERAPLYDEFAKHGIAADKIVECVYGPSSLEAGDHVRTALESGCAAILLTPPFYFKGVGEDGIFNWFCEVLDRAGSGVRDIIVYNIPSLTAVTISTELVSRLRQRYPDAIGGVKDSSGDWDQTQLSPDPSRPCHSGRSRRLSGRCHKARRKRFDQWPCQSGAQDNGKAGQRDP